jgi:hypothetical protein
MRKETEPKPILSIVKELDKNLYSQIIQTVDKKQQEILNALNKLTLDKHDNK